MKKFNYHLMLFVMFFVLVFGCLSAFSQGNLSEIKSKYIKLEGKSSVIDLLNTETSEVVMKGDLVKMPGGNAYWVKNSKLVSGNREILDFGLFLRVNSSNIINQIPAFYGYIIEPQDNNRLSVWIADENGNIISDMIQILVKHTDVLFFAGNVN